MTKIRNYFIIVASVFAISSACALVGVRDVKAQEGPALTDLIKRIEALESRPSGGGNVIAGMKSPIRGLKIGFDVRHRFEFRDQMPNSNGIGAFAAGQLAGFVPPGLAPSQTVVLGTNLPNTVAGVSIPNQKVAGDQSGPGRAETSDFVLQRFRLNLDADINRNVRAFLQLQDVRAFGDEGGTTGNLEATDLQQGYVEARNLGDLNSLLNNTELRIGRWAQNYGNQRLIGSLGWANQGRSYDGARFRWDNKIHWVDLFAFQINEKETGGAAGQSTLSGLDTDEVLYGLYTHFKIHSGTEFEPYFIARSRTQDNQRAPVKDIAFGPFVPPGVGKTGEQRYTVGFRLAGKNIPELPGVDFTFEPAWQMGRVEGLRGPALSGHGIYDVDPRGLAVLGGGNPINVVQDVSNAIQAFAIHAEVGYTFKNVPWTPRIGYAYSFASGDDNPYQGSAKTFDHLYPTGHAHNGYMDMTGWQNIRDHQIHFNVKPTKKLELDLKAHFFRLDEVEDAWYGVAGGTGYAGGRSVIRPGANAVLTNGAIAVADPDAAMFRDVDPDLGQEIDFTLKYKLFDNFGVVAGYSHFFADDFIEDTGFGIDRGVDWAYLQTTVKF